MPKRILKTISEKKLNGTLGIKPACVAMIAYRKAKLKQKINKELYNAKKLTLVAKNA